MQNRIESLFSTRYKAERLDLKISFAIVILTLGVSTGLVLMQYSHGQNMTMSQLELQNEAFKTALDYCFQHADRPNPIQDLIDKGFLSPEFSGETCISVKQKAAILNSLAGEAVQKAQNSVGYLECLAEETNTIDDCNRIQQELDNQWNEIK